MATPGRLLCSSQPALSLCGFSRSPLMLVGCIQWDFKGACSVEMLVQPGRECCWAQTLPFRGTHINLPAGTATRAIHHRTAAWAALPLERPPQLFPSWGSPLPPFPVSGRLMGGRASPTASSVGLRSLKWPQKQCWCPGRMPVLQGGAPCFTGDRKPSADAGQHHHLWVFRGHKFSLQFALLLKAHLPSKGNQSTSAEFYPPAHTPIPTGAARPVQDAGARAGLGRVLGLG